MAKYPELRDRLRTELRHLKTSKSDITNAAAAEKIGVEESTFASWRGGTRYPSSKYFKKLAAYLFPGGESQARTEFLGDLERWAERRERGHADDELGSEERRIKVAGTNDPGGKFLAQCLTRLMRIAGMKFDRIDAGKPIYSLKDSLLTGDADICVGLFATLDRARTIRFFPTPIRVGLNAVVLERDLEEFGMEDKVVNLRRSLTFDKERQPGLRVVPIIVEPDVAGIYITKALELDDFRKIPQVDPLSYAKRLIDFREPKAIPVAVADEITALRILEQLRLLKQKARLVFSLNDHESVQEERRDLPEYLLSISVKRSNRDLIEYLQDALRLFLQTEVQTVSTYYVETRRDLERLAIENYPANGRDAQSKIREVAEAWTKYTFRMDQNDIEIYEDFEVPWRPILRRALDIEEGNSPKRLTGVRRTRDR